MPGRPLHNRRSPRLPGYDYRRAGAYFVTVCVHGRICLLGTISGSQMLHSEAGLMVEEVWRELPARYPNVTLGPAVVMPNHVHGIVVLQPAEDAARPMSLPDVMQRFKSLTTAKYRHGVAERGWLPFEMRLWQRSYHDHIIRGPADMARLEAYIAHNPARWEADQMNPSASGVAPAAPIGHR